MAKAISYFIFSSSGSYLRWDDDTTINFRIRQYEMSITGGGGIDRLYVGAGTKVDAGALFASANTDELYLSGNFNDYSQTISAGGVYTFTGLAGGSHADEVVSFSMNSNGDKLVFANGHVTVKSSDYLTVSGSYSSILAGSLTLVNQTDPTMGAQPGNKPAKVFVFDAGGINIPQLPIVDEAIAVSGGGGVDKFYVRKGTNADAIGLFASAGEDVLYLTGRFDDYTQTKSAGGVYTFTRNFTGADASLTEVVSFSMNSSGDQLVFADGGVTLRLADYLSGGSYADITVGQLNRAITTPGLLAPTPNLILASDTGSSASDRITNNATINVTGLVTGGTWQYQVDGTAGSWTTGTASSLIASSGAHTYFVRQTDAMGNTSAQSTAVTYTLDTTAPVAPTARLAVDSGSSTSDGLTNNPTILVNGLETTTGTSWKYQVDGSGSWISGTGASFTAQSGKHTYVVQQFDVAGNPGAIELVPKVFTLDTMLPTISSASTFGFTENSTATVATLLANSNVTDATEPTTLTWAIDSGADGSFFNIDASTGALSFKNAPNYEMPRNIAPSASNSNAYMVNVMVTDAAGNVARQTITVNVADINETPVAIGTIAQQDWVVGYPVSFNVANAFSDTDSVNTYSAAEAKWGTLSYAQTGLPIGLTINPNTGLIIGTATAMQAVAPVTVTATDGGGLSATQVFSLGISIAPFINSFSVADSNTANGAQLGRAGESLIFRVSTSESVQVTPATGVGAVAPQITFSVNGQAVTATYASGSGTNMLTFTGGMVPTMGNGNNISVTSISLNGGSVTGSVSSVSLSIGAVGQTYSGYTVDNIALAPSLRLAVDSGSSASDGLTNNATINVSGLETGATWQYNVDGSGSWATGTGTSFTATSGAHTYFVRQTDVAGNTEVSSAMGYTIDQSAPATPNQTLISDTGVSSNDGWTNDPHINVAFIENSASWAYQVDGLNWVSGTGLGFTAIEGVHTYVVQQTDRAGNTSALSTPMVCTLDTSAPATPTLSLLHDTGNPSDGITSNPTVNVGNIAAGALWQFNVLDSGGGWVSGSNAVFSALNGRHTYSVRQIDGAGNVSEASVPQVYVLDTDPLNIAVTSFSLAENSADTITLSASKTVTWELVSGQDSGLFVLSGAVLSFVTAPNYELPRGGLPSVNNNNSYTLIVQATDGVGNVVTQGIVVNVTDVNETPVAMGVIPVQTAAQDVAYSFDVRNYFNDPDTGNTDAPAVTGKWGELTYRTTDLPAGLMINTNTGLISGIVASTLAASAITVTASDGVGLSATQTFNLQVVNAPVLSAFTVTDAGNGNGTTLGKSGEALSFVVTMSEAVTVDNHSMPAHTPSIIFSVNGEAVTATYASGSGTNRLTFTGGTVPARGNGNNISVTSISLNDGSVTGNVSNTAWAVGAVGQNYRGYTVDNIALAPSLKLASDTGLSASDGITMNATVNVLGLESAATWSYQVDGSGSWIAGVNSSFVASSGLHSYSVQQIDVAGNTSDTSSVFVYNVDQTAPTALTLTLASDTGIGSSDRITVNPTLVVQGLEAGAKWQYLVDSQVSVAGVGSTGSALEIVQHVGDQAVAGVTFATLATGAQFIDATHKNVSLKFYSPTAGLTVRLRLEDAADATHFIEKDVTTTVADSWQVLTFDFSTPATSAFNPSFTYNRAKLLPDFLGTTKTTARSFYVDDISYNRITTVSGDTPTTTVTPTTITFDLASADTIQAVVFGGTSASIVSAGIPMANPNWVAGLGTSFTASVGTHTYSALQTDVAGNVSSVGSAVTYTVEMVAIPTLSLALDSGSSATDGITNNATILVRGLEVGSSWQYQVDSSAWQAGNANNAFLASSGTHSYSVRGVSVAGNTGLGATPVIYTIDTTLPVTTVQNTTIGASGSVNLQSSELGVAYLVNTTVTVSGLISLITTPDNLWAKVPIRNINTDTALSVSGLSDGTYRVYGADVAGNFSNPSVGTVIIDRTVAMIMSAAISGASGSSSGLLSTGDIVTASVTMSKPVTVTGSPILTLKIGDSLVDATFASSSTSVLNFVYTIHAGQNDANGISIPSNALNLGAGANIVDLLNNNANLSLTAVTDNPSYVVDTTPPALLNLVLLSDTGSNGSDGITNKASILVRNLESGASWQYQVDGTVASSWLTGAGSSFNATSGAHTYFARQTDAAGNMGEPNVGATYTLDTTVATPTLVLLVDTGDSASDSLTNNPTILVSILESLATWEYKTDNGTWRMGSGSFLNATNGNHSYVVRQTDLAGNVSAESARIIINYDNTPPTPPRYSLGMNENTAFVQTLSIVGAELPPVWTLVSSGNSEYKADNAYFNISPAGFLAFKTAPDYERPRGMLASASNTSHYAISLRITDAAGNSSIEQLSIDVLDVNEAPFAVGRVPPQEALRQQGYRIDVHSYFGDQDSVNVYPPASPQWGSLTYSASNLPAGSTIANGIITGTASTSSTTVVTVTATDGGGLSVTQTFNLNVVDGVTVQSFTVQDAGNGNGTQLGLMGELLTFRLVLSEAVTVTGGTPTVSFTFNSNEHVTASYISGSGSNTLLFAGASAMVPSGDGNEIFLTTINLASAQVLGITTRRSWNSALTGGTYYDGYTVDNTPPSAPSLTLASDTGVSASDRLTTNATINVGGLETGATWQYQVDGTAGSWMTGTASSFTASSGAHSYFVRQTDAAGNTSTPSTAVTYTLDTSAPTVNTTSFSVEENTTAVGTLTASETVTWSLGMDLDTELFTLTNSVLSFKTAPNYEMPRGSAFNAASNNDVYTVNVIVTDAAGKASQESLWVYVTDVNEAPIAVGTIATRAATQHVAFSYDVSGSFSDPDTLASNAAWRTLTYSATGLPSGLAINSSTGVISGTANALQAVGTVTVSATDGLSIPATSTQTFDLSVVNGVTVTGFTVTDETGNDSAGKSGGTLLFVVTMSESVTVTTGAGAPQITFTINGQDVVASYLLGNTTRLDFTATAPAFEGHNISLKSINLNGGTVTAAASASRHWDTSIVAQSYSGYTVDDTPPNSPSLTLASDAGSSASDKLTNNLTINVGGLENGATWQYQVDGSGSWATGTDSSFTASAGTHSYSVRQTDAAGNTSVDSTAVTYTFDTSAPTTPSLTLVSDTGTSASDRLTSNATINVSGLETGATWQYQEDSSGSWMTGTASSFTASSGAHSYSVRQTDAAGNTSGASTAVTYTVDTSAPTTPSLTLVSDTGTSASDRLTSNATINVSGLESGATWQYQEDSSGSWMTGTASSFTAGSGAHSYSVRQTDVAGNTSGASTAVTYTVDTSAPDTPTLTLASDAGSSASDRLTSNATINVSGLESGATWQYQEDSSGSWMTGTASSFTASSGAHSYFVRQTDAAGNTSGASTAVTYTLDNTPPATPSLTLASDAGSGASDGLTSNAAINVSGLESGATWQYQVDGTAGSWMTGTASSFTASAGAHSYFVRQTDAAGNTSVDSTAVTYTFDTSAPTTPSLTLASDTGTSASDRLTSNATINVSGLESGATWQYQVDGSAGSWMTGTDSSFTASSGAHSYWVRQTDVAGHTSGASTAVTYTVDTSAPLIPTLTLATDTGSSASDGLTSNATINVGGLETGATWQYQVDGTAGSWATGTASSFTASSGAHSYFVRQTDVAGNTSDASTAVTYTFDTTAPAPSLTLASDTGSNASDGLTSNATINVSGLETGATWQYQVDGTAGSWATGTASSFTASSGAHSYFVRQTDVAGHTSDASTAVTYTVDTTPPATPSLTLASDAGSGASDGLTSNAAINVSGLETGATWQYQVDGTAGSWATGTASSFTASSGAHSYFVRQTDAAGNTSATSTAVTYTVDTSAPVIPSLTLASDTGSSASDGLTSNATINVSGLESGATWQYQVDGTAGSWMTGTASSFTASSGAHSYFVRQTDVAGHTNGASTAVTYTVDTSAPVIPTLTLASDTGSSASDGLTSNATINVSGLESGATWQYQVDGTAGSWITGTDSSFTASAGAHSYWVRQTDAAGNTSDTSTAVTYTFDTTAPAPSLTLASDTGSSASDGLTSNATINVSGLETGATWQYQVDGTAGSWMTGTASSFTASSGAHSYFVRQTDVAGHTSEASTAVTYTVDTSAPAIPSLTLASDTGSSASDRLTNNLTINVSGLETGATWQYQVDGTAGSWMTGTVSSFTASSGAHSYFVRQTDAAGNTSDTSTAVTYTVDTSAPVIPTLTLASDTGSSASDGLTSNGTINVSGLETGATWQYQVDGSGSWATGTDSSFIASSGAHSYWVRQTDAAGNTSDASTVVTYTFDTTAPAPSLTLASDTGSSASDGLTSNATINVGGLETGATWQYQMDGTAGSWMTGTASSFTASSGAHSYFVRQTDAAGNTSDTSTAVTYTVDTTAPTLSTATSPSTALTGGGNSVGDTIVLTITFDGAVNGLSSGTDSTIFKVAGIGVSAVWGGTTATRTLTYTVVAGQNGRATLDEAALKTALVAGISDAAGNAFVYTANSGNIADIDSSALPVIDGTAPATTAIALATAATTTPLNVGNVITATVTMSETVQVTGTPQLTLTIGSTTKQASYSSGTGTTILTFTYAVQKGLFDGDGISIAANAIMLNGGTIQDSVGNTVDPITTLVTNVASLTVDTVSVRLSAVAAGTGGFVINGATSGDGSGGLSISNAGDINNDGFDDFMIGAPSAGSAGKTYVVFGKGTWGSTIELSTVTAGTGGFVITGASNDRSGFSIAVLGDINGDHADDLLIGAPGSTGGGAGKTYVVFSNLSKDMSGNLIAMSNIDLATVAAGTGGFVLNGEAAAASPSPFGDNSGYSVSSAGDVNGDGIVDILVGAPNAASTKGKTYVVFGQLTQPSGIDLSTVAVGTGGFVINGTTSSTADFTDPGDASGWSVTGVGDLNGDGLADLVIGAPFVNRPQSLLEAGETGSDAGASYVVFGKKTNTAIDLTAIAAGTGGFVVYGRKAGDQSGFNVSAAGDVNGDNLADFIVSSPLEDRNVLNNDHQGVSYVVFGKTTTSLIDLKTVLMGSGGGFAINGQNLRDRAGYKTTTVGDFNGDGLSDFLLSSFNETSPASQSHSYLIYGKTTATAIDLNAVEAGTGGFAIRDWQASTAEGTMLGTSVSAAGDVNGDGFVDLLVTSYQATNMTTQGVTVPTVSAGKSYIIFGGSDFIANKVTEYPNRSGVVTGTTANEALVGGSENDALTGNGGVDRFFGGAGNDTIVLTASDITNLASNMPTDNLHATVDGGRGTDSLQLTGGANLDLTTIANIAAGNPNVSGRIVNIEAIDLLLDTAANTLTLSAQSVWSLLTGNEVTVSDYQLEIKKGANDVVVFGDASNWTDPGTLGTASYRTTIQTEFGMFITVIIEQTTAPPIP